MRRLTSILAGMLIAVSGFGAGEGEGAAGEVVEVTHMVADRGIVPAEVGTLQDNWFVDKMNETLAPSGVKVGIVVFPRGEYGAKVNTMMAAGTAPDVMWTWSADQVGKWTQEGGLLDYGQYLDELGPNIRKLYTEEDLATGTFYGKLTALRRIQTWAQWARTTLARQDYLDALGLDPPESVGELYDVLVELKENAEALGHDRESFYPFTMWGTGEWSYYVIPAFTDGEPAPERLAVPPALWPEAKDGLRYLNKLYNEGLMFDDSLDSDSSIRKAIMIDGKAAIIPWWTHGPVFTGYGAIYEKMRTVNPHARLATIFPWGQQPGESKLFFNVGRHGLMFITPSATKHPEAVMTYLDYLASEEGYRTMTIGIKGEHWEPTADGGFKRLIDESAVTRLISWIQPCFEVLSLPFERASLNAKVLYGTMAHADEFLVWTDEVEAAGNYPRPIINLPNPARDRYFGVIEGEWRDALPKIITASESEFDALFDQAVAAYRANGGDEVEQEALANYRKIHGQ